MILNSASSTLSNQLLCNVMTTGLSGNVFATMQLIMYSVLRKGRDSAYGINAERHIICKEATQNKMSQTDKVLSIATIAVPSLALWLLVGLAVPFEHCVAALQSAMILCQEPAADIDGIGSVFLVPSHCWLRQGLPMATQRKL